MEVSRLPCRLCLTVTDFNVSLFDKYCRKTNMIEKILVCLKLVIEETDRLQTICYKCAESVERFYDFIAFVKKAQTRHYNEKYEPKRSSEPPLPNLNRRHVTTYVRERVFDADYTFSSHEMSPEEDGKQIKTSSPFFSYFSTPNVRPKPSAEPRIWKTPRPRCDLNQKSDQKCRIEKHAKKEKPRQFSRDLFESQSSDTPLESQVAQEPQPRCLDWKFTPDESIIKRVREKCFGPSDF